MGSPSWTGGIVLSTTFEMSPQKMKSAVRLLPSVGKRTHSLVLQLRGVGRGRGGRAGRYLIIFVLPNGK